MTETENIILMDEGRIARSLKRIAQQITEHNRDGKKVMLVGINTRGFSVASAIKKYLTSLYNEEIDCTQLTVGEGEPGAVWKENPDPENYFMVLVDDVIFSGKTMFQALIRLEELLGLKEIHTAVLVNRGHRKLPVEAEYVGIELPTKLNEHVSVEVSSKGNPKQVVLIKS